MLRTKISLVIIAALAVFIFACKQTSQKPKTEVLENQPKKSVMYEMSELALLMEAMYDSLSHWKTSIQNGETINTSFPEAFKTIHTAKYTNGMGVGDDFYNNMGYAFLTTVDSLVSATPKNVEERYTAVVSTCITCHQAKCPGPLVRIKKLQF